MYVAGNGDDGAGYNTEYCSRVHIWWQRWDPIVGQFVDNSTRVQGNTERRFTSRMTTRSGKEYKSQPVSEESMEAILKALMEDRQKREQELMTQQAAEDLRRNEERVARERREEAWREERKEMQEHMQTMVEMMRTSGEMRAARRNHRRGEVSSWFR